MNGIVFPSGRIVSHFMPGSHVAVHMYGKEGWDGRRGGPWALGIIQESDSGMRFVVIALDRPSQGYYKYPETVMNIQRPELLKLEDFAMLRTSPTLADAWVREAPKGVDDFDRQKFLAHLRVPVKFMPDFGHPAVPQMAPVHTADFHQLFIDAAG